MTGLASRFGGIPRHASWRGRSGRSYSLLAERMDVFSLTPGALYLVAKGSIVLWVGSAEDVISDQQSRARFRLALAAADRAFLVEGAESEEKRLATVWDLEGAEPEAGLSAA